MRWFVVGSLEQWLLVDWRIISIASRSNRGKRLYSHFINQQSGHPQPATIVNDAEDRQCPEISSGCLSVYVAWRAHDGTGLTILQKYNSNIVKRLPGGPFFSKEAVCHPSISYLYLAVAHGFPRVTCSISTHTNTLVWPTPRYSNSRILPITANHSHGGVRRPSTSRRIRVSSKFPPGNLRLPHIQSTRVLRDRLFVAGQAQGGPSELPQNSPNRDTDQISAR